MNQLVSKLIWYNILFLVFTQVPVTALYSFGNLPEWLCHLESILVPSILLGLLIIVDAISIVRFLFIFCMKNPTANQDDFWSWFLFSWSFFMSITYTSALHILPGKNPHFFYICKGSAPKDMYTAISKGNPLLFFKVLSSLIISVLIYLKIKFYKKSQNAQSKSIINGIFEKRNLPNATFCFFTIFTIFGLASYIWFMNRMDLETVTNYPGYIWIQVLNLCFVPVANFIYLSVILAKDKKIRIFIFKEWKCFFSCSHY